MGPLDQELSKYGDSDFYPFHMPGHKRNLSGNNDLSLVSRLDITEIDGFDNLHHPEGIIKELEEQIADLYQTEESCLLVNGSTCGILAAICGCVPPNGRLLLSRNSHKSAYNALSLNENEGIFLYPEFIEEYEICGGITPSSVKTALKNNKDISAVFITSPTYEGIISDIEGIAAVVHEFGIPLIVDEAHGAHLHFCTNFPNEYYMNSAVSSHADIIIESLHKTLPAFTQTAVLHFQGELVDRMKVKDYLSIFQSSSPSYLLMASASQCINLLKEEKTNLFSEYKDRLLSFYQDLKQLNRLKILRPSIIGLNGVAGFDIGKIMISSKNTDKNGKEIYQILLNRYHLQLEMAEGNECLAMTSILDTSEGFFRLKNALLEIDSAMSGQNFVEKGFQYPITSQIMCIKKALNCKKESRKLAETAGRISANYLYLYPPGVPIVAPGEQITRQVIDFVNLQNRNQVEVRGMIQGRIEVIIN